MWAKLGASFLALTFILDVVVCRVVKVTFRQAACLIGNGVRDVVPTTEVAVEGLHTEKTSKPE